MPEEASPKWPDAVSTAFLLLPGFITIRVSEYYSTGDKLSEVETVASALAFTLVTLVCALLLWRAGERVFSGVYSPISGVGQRAPFLALIVTMAIGFGFLWAWADSHDVAYRVSPTRRVSRQPMWQWLFDSNAARTEPRFVKVMLEDGTTYFGPPARYSRSEGAETLYLEPAAKIEGRKAKDTKEGLKADGAEESMSSKLRRCREVVGGVLVRKEAVDIVEFYPVTQAEKRVMGYCELLVEKTAERTKAAAGGAKVGAK
jgi:hypothetical protein